MTWNRKLMALAVGLMTIVAAFGETPKPPELAFVQEITSIDLPEGHEWYTVLVTTEGKGERVAAWFDQDERLARLKDSTEFRRYDSESPLFKTHLKASYGNDYPILVIQDATGAMRSQLGGTQLNSLAGPSELVAQLDAAANRLRPADQKKVSQWGRVCPGPDCPDPNQVPEERPPAPVNPDDQPRATPVLDFAIDKSKTGAITALLSGNLPLAAMMAAAAGGVYLLKRRRQSRGVQLRRVTR